MPDQNREKVLRQTLIAASVDLVLCVVPYLLTTSNTLLADLLKTALEWGAVLLSWFTLKGIARSDRGSFNYGLGKLENISSLLVGFLMMSVAILIAISAGKDLMGKPEVISGYGIWISLATELTFGIINGRLYFKNHQLGVTSKSPVIQSQARLFLSRTIGNLFMLLAVSLMVVFQDHEWGVYIDPIVAILISGAILISAVGVFRGSFFDLLDRTLEEKDQLLILRALVDQYEHYDEVRDIRSRRAGGREIIEIFLAYAPERTIGEALFAMDQVKCSITQQFPDAEVMVILSPTTVHENTYRVS